jgi:hypothetical protein
MAQNKLDIDEAEERKLRRRPWSNLAIILALVLGTGLLCDQESPAAMRFYAISMGVLIIISLLLYRESRIITGMLLFVLCLLLAVIFFF